jgi:hypothetical protein
MNIPIKPITAKTINRFPMLYKMQAQKAIEYEVRDAIRTTADSFVMAAILALVEEFDFGTKPNSSRIPRFVMKLQDIIDINAAYYDDAIAEGLRNKLHNLGIEYDREGRR